MPVSVSTLRPADIIVSTTECWHFRCDSRRHWVLGEPTSAGVLSSPGAVAGNSAGLRQRTGWDGRGPARRITGIVGWARPAVAQDPA